MGRKYRGAGRAFGIVLINFFPFMTERRNAYFKKKAIKGETLDRHSKERETGIEPATSTLARWSSNR